MLTPGIKRWLWFIALWATGVGSLLLLALIIRLLLPSM